MIVLCITRVTASEQRFFSHSTTLNITVCVASGLTMRYCDRQGGVAKVIQVACIDGAPQIQYATKQ